MSRRPSRNPSQIVRYLSRRSVTDQSENGPPRVELPRQGRNSEVYLVTAASGKRWVLRAFRQARACREYSALLKQFTAKGLPVSRPLWSDMSLATRCRYQRSFGAEEFVAGPLLADVGPNPVAIQAVLRSLAQLHDEISPTWGKRGQPRTEDFRVYLFQQCRRWLSALPASSPFGKSGDKQQWEQMLQAWSAQLPVQTQFSLIHGKLGAAGTIVSQGMARAVFIDTGSLTYGHFMHDLPYLFPFLSAGEERVKEHLVDQYLALRKTLPADFNYQRVEAFFFARYHLRKLRAVHKKLSVEEVGDNPKAASHYASLCELTKTFRQY